MTGVIVEHAFLDSASDAAKLKDENFLKSWEKQMQQELQQLTGSAKAITETSRQLCRLKIKMILMELHRLR